MCAACCLLHRRPKTITGFLDSSKPSGLCTHLFNRGLSTGPATPASVDRPPWLDERQLRNVMNAGHVAPPTIRFLNYESLDL